MSFHLDVCNNSVEHNYFDSLSEDECDNWICIEKKT